MTTQNPISSILSAGYVAPRSSDVYKALTLPEVMSLQLPANAVGVLTDLALGEDDKWHLAGYDKETRTLKDAPMVIATRDARRFGHYGNDDFNAFILRSTAYVAMQELGGAISIHADFDFYALAPEVVAEFDALADYERAYLLVAKNNPNTMRLVCYKAGEWFPAVQEVQPQMNRDELNRVYRTGKFRISAARSHVNMLTTIAQRNAKLAEDGLNQIDATAILDRWSAAVRFAMEQRVVVPLFAYRDLPVFNDAGEIVIDPMTNLPKTRAESNDELRDRFISEKYQSIVDGYRYQQAMASGLGAQYIEAKKAQRA